MKKNVGFLGVMLSVALILSFIESLIPFYFGVPGMKLGLTNVIVILALYLFGPVEAITISVLRIVLSGFLFGNAFSIIYSLAGGLLSFFVMFLLKRFAKLGVIPISITGGIFHNVGQIIVAILVMNNIYLMYYMPVLLIAGFVTGALIGIIACELVRRLSKIMEER